MVFLVFLVMALQAAESGGPAGAAAQVLSDAPGDRFGAALAVVGDLDGDGLDELLVGAPRAGQAAEGAGRALVVSGSDRRVLLEIHGESAWDRLGWAVAAPGDLDGDGSPDLLIGAPGGHPPAGRAVVVSGASGRPLFTLSGSAAGDRFGHSVAGLGDVDGDGVPDLVVGAPHADGAGLNSGRVSVHSGRDGRLLFARDGGPSDQLGLAVSAAGDLDGDGATEVLVGAPFSDIGAFNGGTAWIFGGRDGRLLGSHHGLGIGDQLGTWVAGLGDVDGDGMPDQGLGAPGSDAGALDGGAVVVRSGASGGVSFTVVGRLAGGLLGIVAPAGDVDRDGRCDLLVGSPEGGSLAPPEGEVRLVSGAGGHDLFVARGARPLDAFGASIARWDTRAANPGLAVGAPGNEDHAETLGSVWLLAPTLPGGGALSAPRPPR